jgi:hypothetical protein
LKKKRAFYKFANLLKTGAAYLMLLGMRANGKSYAVKEEVLKDAYQNKINFVYLRRWREDIKQAAVEAYFADMPIEKITDGKYNAVVAWQSYLYFAVVTDEGHAERGQRIGRYCALNEAIRYKSQAFVNYGWIVYEEFITDEVYLSEEPTKLLQFVSTVARLGSIKVVLIGNTMSRVCPYFNEWQLQGTLRQKPGTIEVYHMHYDKFTVDIAVENCEVLERDSLLFFGSAAKQIISGEWDVKESPRLPKKLKEYDEVFRLDVKFNLLSFHLTLLVDDTGQMLLYIFPAKSHKKDVRLITDDFANDVYTTRHLRRDSRAELKLAECWRQGKVCYSDNLTAADFNNVNKNFSIF